MKTFIQEKIKKYGKRAFYIWLSWIVIKWSIFFYFGNEIVTFIWK